LNIILLADFCKFILFIFCTPLYCCLMLTTYIMQKKKLRPCAARHLVSTVLKPGSTIPITDILRPIAIATALEKHTINCFRKARSDLVEWFTYYFDSRLIIFAIFFRVSKERAFGGNSNRDRSNDAIGHVSSSTLDTIIQFLNFYRAVGGVTLQIRTYTYWS
jgi:hypothetical protein